MHERFYDLNGHIYYIFENVSQAGDFRFYDIDETGRVNDEFSIMNPLFYQFYYYDGLNRLTDIEQGIPGQNSIVYSYDLSGNRIDQTLNNDTVYTYNINANSNRLQSQSGAQAINYSYDPAGNLTSDGTFRYGYNAASRRTSATAAGQTTTYGYDALGQRVSKTAAGSTTRYFYDEQGHLTGEYNAAGRLIQEIIWLGDLPIAVLKPATPTSAVINTYYIHSDHLGTPRKITRPADNRVVWNWVPEAFGNSLPNQNPSGLGNFVFNLRFPGQYYDQETGLHYNMARYYNPKIGRYEQSDPIGLRGRATAYKSLCK